MQVYRTRGEIAIPQSLAPIPEGTQIVDKNGAITTFFRLRWESLINGFQFTPTVAVVQLTGQHATIVTTAAFTTLTAGRYRISYYLRKTAADGVSSSLTVTLGWTESGIALSESGAALATDTTAAQQSGEKVVDVDAAVDITYAVLYASNTPNQMVYRLTINVEQLA